MTLPTAAEAPPQFLDAKTRAVGRRVELDTFGGGLTERFLLERAERLIPETAGHPIARSIAVANVANTLRAQAEVATAFELTVAAEVFDVLGLTHVAPKFVADGVLLRSFDPTVEPASLHISAKAGVTTRLLIEVERRGREHTWFARSSYTTTDAPDWHQRG